MGTGVLLAPGSDAWWLIRKQNGVAGGNRAGIPHAALAHCGSPGITVPRQLRRLPSMSI